MGIEKMKKISFIICLLLCLTSCVNSEYELVFESNQKEFRDICITRERKWFRGEDSHIDVYIVPMNLTDTTFNLYNIYINGNKYYTSSEPIIIKKFKYIGDKK